ncbi:uncharacterized protein J3D65DRAFT_633042 [Phyllosticta citribraziliensis]|uniref:CDP-diacylglycerol--glycerol-3-phosphate 3-phosphatidyltransferase n=1 Tax=Phyllosticta citribraziliensis TaxID=989973 RepID=A0ABR1LHY3_9PEZI
MKMFARGVVRCARLRSPAHSLKRATPGAQVVKRYSSTSAAAANTPAPAQSGASLLGSLTTELDKISPRFEVEPEQIEILKTPSEFYETLKAKISTAQRRIYLSTLYIGKTEHELISVIWDALQRNPKLKVSFLTDALRGTRETPEPSCASLLAPLITEFGEDRVEIRMFHTPNLHGLRKKLIPKRINEGWGLQHMKLYGVDDELIMSGANLSNDYFTNRQDRYHVFHSAAIADYFARIHAAVCKLSYQILPAPKDEPAGYTMSWPASNPSPSPLDDRHAFKRAASTLLTPLIRPSTPPPPSPFIRSSSSSLSTTTLIYPLLQFTPILPSSTDTSTELPALTSLLTLLTQPAHHGSTWTFTAGYFNMTPHMRNLLLGSNPARGTVIAASPRANGFYGSPGVSGLLPPAYTHLAEVFLRAVERAHLAARVRLMEWQRGSVGEPGGWTYHAKGLWVSSPPSPQSRQHQQDRNDNAPRPLPQVSLIGSSNYTARSHALDLEANVLVVTRSPDLMRRLGDEEALLRAYARDVGWDEFAKVERRVGLHVRLAMGIVRVLGGAL